jgi:hypothetical protein
MHGAHQEERAILDRQTASNVEWKERDRMCKNIKNIIRINVMFDSSIDYSKITFAKPVMQGDRYFIQAVHGEGDKSERIVTQFNKWMTCKTDMVSSDGKQASQIEVIIPGKDGMVSPFIEFISDFDEAMMKAAKDKKDVWFPGKEITDEWLDQAFHNSFKQVKKSFDATVRIRVSKELEVYTSERIETSTEDVCDGSRIAMIVMMDGVWFTKSRFGLTWKVVQMKVHKEKEPTRKYMFDDEVTSTIDMDNVFPDDM